MARKPKRMALHEAIRQGQLKIADGLKNGQMRSDTTRQTPQKVRPLGFQVPDVSHNALLESEDKAPKLARPSKAMMVGLGIAAQVLILGLGIWLGILFMRPGDEATVSQEAGQEAANENDGHLFAGSPSNSDETAEKVEKTEEKKSETGFLWKKPKSSDEKKQESKVAEVKTEAKKKQPVAPVVSSGGNVIVIQSMTPSRKSELKPLQDYFKKKGIATTIIVDSGSDYCLLVTKAGFKRNPGIRGTDGYVLYNRIRQLGLSYVDETGNTDFGVRPFQDIYGYKLK